LVSQKTIEFDVIKAVLQGYYPKSPLLDKVIQHAISRQEKATELKKIGNFSSISDLYLENIESHSTISDLWTFFPPVFVRSVIKTILPPPYQINSIISFIMESILTSFLTDIIEKAVPCFLAHKNGEEFTSTFIEAAIQNDPVLSYIWGSSFFCSEMNIEEVSSIKTEDWGSLYPTFSSSNWCHLLNEISKNLLLFVQNDVLSILSHNDFVTAFDVLDMLTTNITLFSRSTGIHFFGIWKLNENMISTVESCFPLSWNEDNLVAFLNKMGIEDKEEAELPFAEWQKREENILRKMNLKLNSNYFRHHAVPPHFMNGKQLTEISWNYLQATVERFVASLIAGSEKTKVISPSVILAILRIKGLEMLFPAQQPFAEISELSRLFVPKRRKIEVLPFQQYENLKYYRLYPVRNAVDYFQSFHKGEKKCIGHNSVPTIAGVFLMEMIHHMKDTKTLIFHHFDVRGLMKATLPRSYQLSLGVIAHVRLFLFHL
jgi:hypothetical protein